MQELIQTRKIMENERKQIILQVIALLINTVNKSFVVHSMNQNLQIKYLMMKKFQLVQCIDDYKLFLM